MRLLKYSAMSRYKRTNKAPEEHCVDAFEYYNDETVARYGESEMQYTRQKVVYVYISGLILQQRIVISQFCILAISPFFRSLCIAQDLSSTECNESLST